MGKVKDLTPTIIEGLKYYTISQFAELVDRDRVYISMLINKGTRIRKLKHVRLGGKPFILASEAHDFPFGRRLRAADRLAEQEKINAASACSPLAAQAVRNARIKGMPEPADIDIDIDKPIVMEPISDLTLTEVMDDADNAQALPGQWPAY